MCYLMWASSASKKRKIISLYVSSDMYKKVTALSISLIFKVREAPIYISTQIAFSISVVELCVC